MLVFFFWNGMRIEADLKKQEVFKRKYSAVRQ